MNRGCIIGNVLIHWELVKVAENEENELMLTVLILLRFMMHLVIQGSICLWVQGKSGIDAAPGSDICLTSFQRLFKLNRLESEIFKSHREACWASASATSTYSIYISWSWMNEWLFFLYIAASWWEGDFLMTKNMR